MAFAPPSQKISNQFMEDMARIHDLSKVLKVEPLAFA
jgi:hypothetical protein